MVVSVGLRKHMGRDGRVAGLQGDDACREQMRDEPGGETLLVLCSLEGNVKARKELCRAGWVVLSPAWRCISVSAVLQT